MTRSSHHTRPRPLLVSLFVVALALATPLWSPSPARATDVVPGTVAPGASASAEATPSPAPTSTPSPSTPASPAPAPLIVIDPGHGGIYSNANANGLREKMVNLYVARALRDALVARGYRVAMTRNSDRAITYADISTWNWSSTYDLWRFARDHYRYYSPSIPKDDLQGRVNIANKAGADLFISVHANGAYSRRARGYETFASSRDALGLVVRSAVQKEVIRRTGLRDRGAQRADFYVLRWSNMPAILLESAFITNPYDAYLLKQSWFRRKLASAVASSVDAWFKNGGCCQVYPRITATSTAGFAAKIALSTDTPGTSAVLIRQDQWAEVPGAAAYAASLGAPLLLCGSSGPGTETASALSRLAPHNVVLLGLADSFDASASVNVAAAAGIGTGDVELVTAANRSLLAAALASRIPVGISGQVLVADSDDTTSALGAAAVAAALKTPLMLADDGILPLSAEDYLARNRSSIERVVLVGATPVLPDFASAGLPFVRYSGASVVSVGTALNTSVVSASACSRPIVADPANPAAYLVSSARAGRLGSTVMPLQGRVMTGTGRLWITNRRLAIQGFEIHDAEGTLPYLVDAMLKKAEYY